MLGLDTNILVRFVTGDEPRQSEAVRAMLADAEREGESLHVTTIVLCELVWVLTRSYRFDRARVSGLLRDLLEVPLFEIQSRQQVRRAVEAYAAGKADFADHLIREEDRQAGCRATLTLDQGLDGIPGFVSLPPRKPRLDLR